MFVIWNKSKDKYWSKRQKAWLSFFEATIFESKLEMPAKKEVKSGNMNEEIFILEIFNE